MTEQIISILPIGKPASDTSSQDKALELLTPESMIAESLAAGDIMIDYELASLRKPTHNTPAPAAGWITHLFCEQQHLMAKILWTSKAYAMIRENEYRYISPYFLINRQRHILRITGAGLVNRTNSAPQACNERQAFFGASLGKSPTAGLFRWFKKSPYQTIAATPRLSTNTASILTKRPTRQPIRQPARRNICVLSNRLSIGAS